MRIPFIFASIAAVAIVAARAGAAPRLSAASVLAANHRAMGEEAQTGTLYVRYLYSGQGLSGFATRTSDLATGNFVESYSVGPISGGSGYDGKTPWMRDASGANTAQEGGDRIPLAVNAAYRNGNLWWQPHFAGASITYAGRATSAGRPADHLVVTPQGGKQFDAWFDARTHLLSQVDEEQGFFATRTFYATYVRKVKLMLPLVTTLDRGTGGANYETLELRAASVTKTLPATAYARPSEPPRGAFIARGAPSTTLPFRLLNNHIYIQGTVDGKGPFTFIVDTGGHTLLSPHLVAETGLHSHGKGASSGVGAKTVPTGFAKVATIALGGVRMLDQTAFVTNVYDASVEGIPVDGMVGFELFRRFAVRIDYGNRTITFYNAAHFKPVNAGQAIPFKFYDHLPDVEGLIDGVPARFDIDTGSRSELDVTSPFVKRTRLREKFPHGVDALTGWGVGGAVRSRVVRLPAISLREVTVRGLVAELSDAKGGSFSDANFDGNIGSAFLKRFVVTFDYANQRLYLKRILPAPADVGTFDRSGLWINAEPAGYIVTSVDRHSPAAEAGLVAGDLITALDGKPSRMGSLSDARKSLRTLPPGTVVRVNVRRAGTRRTVNIVLRDLIPPADEAG